MKDSCAVCCSFDRPLGVPVSEEGEMKFCSAGCEDTFKAWTDSGSSQSLFQFYLKKKYPQEGASP